MAQPLRTSDVRPDGTLIRMYNAATRAEKRIAQAAAAKQEQVVNDAYEIYVEVAAKAAAIWKKHARFVMWGDRAVKTVPQDSPGHAELQIALAEKQEAHEAWQTEARRHGAHYVDPMPRRDEEQ